MSETGAAKAKLAQTAAGLQANFERTLALRASRLERSLASELSLVAWDRQRLIGQAQQRVRELRGQRARERNAQASLDEAAEGVCVLELRAQPLECLPAVWAHLRRGVRVCLKPERDASRAGVDLLAQVAELFAPGSLRVLDAEASTPDDALAWPRAGVEPAGARVALVQRDADHEVSAYLLARACLRRTGFDPRSVHRAVLDGPRPRLERQLQRLWVGATMGPPSDPHAFAGPVRPEDEARYLASIDTWAQLPGCELLCNGGVLQGPAGADEAEHQRYLAPALFRLRSADTLDEPPPTFGPMLVLEETEPGESERRLNGIAPRDSGALWLRFGARPKSVALRTDDRQVDGALLMEHLPPGLPAPRP